jgi:hypothetical protein
MQAWTASNRLLAEAGVAAASSKPAVDRASSAALT